jgi:hypothetical protein
MLVTKDGSGVVGHRDMVRRMRDDPVLWIENTLKIRTKRGELVPFRLNIFQRKLVTAVMDSTGGR